jgi:hypothetical protein
VAAVMPLYLKSHSQGEYVFDWSWADAYERAGGRYYPKLQCAAPFSPVTGPRLLVRPDIDPDEGRQTLLAGPLQQLMRQGRRPTQPALPRGQNDFQPLAVDGGPEVLGIYRWERCNNAWLGLARN